MFDKDEDGVVKVAEIGPMLRSVGFNPSEVEIQLLQEEQDTDNGCLYIAVSIVNIRHRNIGVGAQSTLGGTTFLPEKYV